MTCQKHPHYDGIEPAENCRACRKIRKEAKRMGFAKAAKAVTPNTPDSIDVKGDKAEVTKMTDKNVRSLEDLIRVCSIDTNEWEVERYLCNKWEVGAKGVDDRIHVSPLFQVKAWLKRKTQIIDAREEIKDLIHEARKHIPFRPAKASSLRSGNMLEINIPDLHFGKLAWSDETGGRNYDGKLAEETYETALDELLARTASYPIDKVVYVVGNDLLHSDNKFGTTTSGTPLDTDSRFQKNFKRVRQMTVRAIERLRAVAPVQVILVPGNHDQLSVWHLGDSLDCRFGSSAPDVSIDNTPILRKYTDFGKVMLMFTHGNKGKLKEYPILMATEQPAMFGRTRFREAHTGDKHQTQVQEIHGVRVRILPALCPPDAWHSEMTFVGNLESAEAFVWNKDAGMIGTSVYTVPPTC